MSYPEVTKSRNNKIKPCGPNLDQSASGGTIRVHDLMEAENISQLISCPMNSVRVRTSGSFTR